MVYPTRRSSVAPRRVALRHSPEALRAWYWMAVGALAMLSSLGLYLINPLEHILTWQTSLSPGTLAFSFWDSPLDVLYIRAYTFNVTNAEAFLSGDEKLNLQEVGPFVYREVTHFANLTVHDNDTASFRAQRHLEFLPHFSVGDPKDYILTVPNMPLLAAAAMLGESALVTNLALRSLALFVGARPFITLSADKFLWGYDDALVSMAHSVAPSFVDFRRLGLLDRMYSEDDDVVVNAGPNAGVDPAAKVAKGVYSIRTYNGDTGFPQWGHGVQPRHDPDTGEELPAAMPCDTVEGSYEGVLFPRNVKPGQSMYVYRKQFCRAVPIQFAEEGYTDEGFHYYFYELYLPGLLNPEDKENTCYCAKSAGLDGGCMPSGFSSISPCYYKMPVALSPPHLMHTDPNLANKITGLTPSADLHDSYFRLQPETGIPLNIRCRIQINLMMGHTRLSLTQPFNHMALPLLWIDMSMDLPDHLKRLVTMAVRVGPAVQTAALVLLMLAGAAMAAWGWLLRQRLAARRPSMTARSVRSPSLNFVPRIQHHITTFH